MKRTKTKGKTVDEAIESGLSVLGIKREEADIKVLNEGKGGVLGVFGGEDAEVEIIKKEGLEGEAKTILQELLDKMGFMTIVSSKGEKEGLICLEIKGEDIGRIIGKEGGTLEALQALLGAMMSKSAKRRVRILLDAAGYRERRARKIEKIAREAIDKVEKTGKETVLPPMSAADRRIVHLFVKEREGVESFSKGERDGRRVVIVPKGKAKEMLEKGAKEELSMEEGIKESEEERGPIL